MSNAILKMRLSGEWYDPDTGVRVPFQFGETTIEGAGKLVTGPKVASIGTSFEALPEITDGGVGGLLVVQNLDATNYIEVYTASAGVAMTRCLKAGSDVPQIMRLDNSLTAPGFKANTASCKLKYLYLPV